MDWTLLLRRLTPNSCQMNRWKVSDTEKAVQHVLGVINFLRLNFEAHNVIAMGPMLGTHVNYEFFM